MAAGLLFVYSEDLDSFSVGAGDHLSVGRQRVADELLPGLSDDDAQRA
jgi:hypothetical protein